jgi:hypothetical protein
MQACIHDVLMSKAKKILPFQISKVGDAPSPYILATTQQI